MNAKAKKRLVVVSGIVIAVLAVMLAFAGRSGAAAVLSVRDAASGSHIGERVQVTGNVVEGTHDSDGNTVSFAIYDPDEESARLEVIYEGAVSSTFGSDMTAICTGRIDDDGRLVCSELVTKCPSKYESGVEALSVERLLGYGETMFGMPVKVEGLIAEDPSAEADSARRFLLEDPDTSETLAVLYDGEIPQDADEGTAVILTGSLQDDGVFQATAISLKE